MRLFASFCAATLVYLVVGHMVGIRPSRSPARQRGATIRRRLTMWLDSAEVGVTPEAFAGVAAGSMMSGFVVGFLVLGVPALAMIAAVTAGLLPVLVVGRRGVAISCERRAAWPDALRDLTTSLRSGSSMHTALVDLSRLGPVPLRSAFARYEMLANALDHRVALETVRNELADPLADRIIEVLLVAFDQGTRVIIDVLDDLAESATADLHMLADIDTARLETTLEARGAAVLPFVVLALLCLGSDGYRAFYASAAGSLVIAAGAVMSVLGVLLIARLGRVEHEPRTLVSGVEPC